MGAVSSAISNSGSSANLGQESPTALDARQPINPLLRPGPGGRARRATSPATAVTRYATASTPVTALQVRPNSAQLGLLDARRGVGSPDL